MTAGIDCWVIEPAFLAEYRALGDRALRLFGLPIAGMGPDPASGRAVQYFQRARFELRPDGGVDFGLVGSELLRALGQAA